MAQTRPIPLAAHDTSVRTPGQHPQEVGPDRGAHRLHRRRRGSLAADNDLHQQERTRSPRSSTTDLPMIRLFGDRTFTVQMRLSGTGEMDEAVSLCVYRG